MTARSPGEPARGRGPAGRGRGPAGRAGNGGEGGTEAGTGIGADTGTVAYGGSHRTPESGHHTSVPHTSTQPGTGAEAETGTEVGRETEAGTRAGAGPVAYGLDHRTAATGTSTGTSTVTGTGTSREPVAYEHGSRRATPRADLAVVGGTVVTPDGPRAGTLLVDAGRVRAIVPPDTPVDAAETIDATGLHITPGVIDLHVHFDVPGISLETDFHTGTRSAAAGGVTFVVEHPFSDPPTTTAARYRAKVRRAEAGAVVDFGLWGALTAPSLAEMAGQHDLGAPGFKAFLPENDMGFPPATESDLLTGMATAARLGARVLVHAEDRDALASGEARLRADGRTDFAALLEARPPATEIDAVRDVLRLARRTGCAVHLVHLSTPEAIDLVAEARAAGLDATCEVTAHHLLLNADELPELGGFAVCAPPLRDAHRVELLWDRVRSGRVQAVVSDHCPYGRAEKLAASDDVFGCPFGIQSVQEYVPLVISEALRRGMSPAEIVPLLTSGPARIAGAAAKGALRPGMDADFALLDLDASWTVSAEKQQHAAERWSPYDGRTSTVKVVRTVVRGRTVAVGGDVVAPKGTGRFLPLSGPVGPVGPVARTADQDEEETACRI